MPLIPGQNITINTPIFTLQLDAGYVPDNCQLESSAFALDKQSLVRCKEDYVYTNQLTLPGDAIIRSASGQSFTIDLDKLPLNVERVAIAVSIVNSQQTHHTIRALRALSIKSDTIAEMCFELDTEGRSEQAMILCEIYRRADKWKFKAIGQGFNEGLRALAAHYGVTI